MVSASQQKTQRACLASSATANSSLMTQDFHQHQLTSLESASASWPPGTGQKEGDTVFQPAWRAKNCL